MALAAMGKKTTIEKDGLATAISAKGGKKEKQKKKVRWQPDDKLVRVKIIERAVYDDDVRMGRGDEEMEDGGEVVSFFFYVVVVFRCESFADPACR
jgi:hypothetical protein